MDGWMDGSLSGGRGRKRVSVNVCVQHLRGIISEYPVAAEAAADTIARLHLHAWTLILLHIEYRHLHRGGSVNQTQASRRRAADYAANSYANILTNCCRLS